MRLLTLQNDGSFSLTRELVEDIPPYSILSHTWGEHDQEVTFYDIQHHTGQYKKGYEKLRFCGERAALDGLHYFWVDTCCIDKSSSAELTEAINSMFYWYQNAARCYVYLSDVSKGEDRDAQNALWTMAFMKSRYFTRGWTLQELLAPKSVVFFSAEGRRLGDKASLETLLQDITQIPIDALRGRQLSEFSIRERFSWLGTRKTKRAEDRAYSLFGIFNVYLPLIYGEGEKNAFIRLQNEINNRIQSYTEPYNGNNFHLEATQTSGLRIKQGRSDFKSNITLTNNALSNQGNKILNVIQGDLEQEGSDFSGHISAVDQAQIFQGDQINARLIRAE